MLFMCMLHAFHVTCYDYSELHCIIENVHSRNLFFNIFTWNPGRIKTEDLGRISQWIFFVLPYWVTLELHVQLVNIMLNGEAGLCNYTRTSKGQIIFSGLVGVTTPSDQPKTLRLSFDPHDPNAPPMIRQCLALWRHMVLVLATRRPAPLQVCTCWFR